jgi:hypothetical protein
MLALLTAPVAAMIMFSDPNVQYEVTATTVTTEPGPALPTRKIEFLGDSMIITAGFCNECKFVPAGHVSPFDHNEEFDESRDHKVCSTLAQCHTTTVRKKTRTDSAWSATAAVATPRCLPSSTGR